MHSFRLVKPTPISLKLSRWCHIATPNPKECVFSIESILVCSVCCSWMVLWTGKSSQNQLFRIVFDWFIEWSFFECTISYFYRFVNWKPNKTKTKLNRKKITNLELFLVWKCLWRQTTDEICCTMKPSWIFMWKRVRSLQISLVGKFFSFFFFKLEIELNFVKADKFSRLWVWPIP